jgi:hypothetical protein
MATTSSDSNSGNGSGGSGTNTGGSSGSGSSGSGSSGGTSGPSSGPTPSVALGTNLGQLSENEKPDVKLSQDTVTKYVNAVDAFRVALQGHRNDMITVAPLGDPGTLGSAKQTAANLELDVHGSGGVVDMVDQYLEYLINFEAAVQKAGSRMIQSG